MGVVEGSRALGRTGLGIADGAICETLLADEGIVVGRLEVVAEAGKTGLD